MTAPSISVIIPVYKVEEYLDFCVESVLNQTFKDFEIILVDDGSPDLCPEMCDAYSRQDSRIKVIHKENEGLGLARNTGIDNASGKYICFLDSDDSLDSDALEYCYVLAEKNSADEVRFLFKRFTSDVLPQSTMEREGEIVEVITDGDARLNPILNVVAPILSRPALSVATTASSCTALYRRDIIESNNIRFYSERELISEDYIFNIQFAFSCRKIIYTNRAIYNYRINQKSLTRIFNKNRIEMSIKFSKFLELLMKEYHYPYSKQFAQGFTIGELRAQNKAIVRADISLSEKRKYFREMTDYEYVREIKRDYPIRRLSLAQQCVFFCQTNKLYWLSWILSVIKMKSEE